MFTLFGRTQILENSLPILWFLISILLWFFLINFSSFLGAADFEHLIQGSFKLQMHFDQPKSNRSSSYAFNEGPSFAVQNLHKTLAERTLREATHSVWSSAQRERTSLNSKISSWSRHVYGRVLDIAEYRLTEYGSPGELHRWSNRWPAIKTFEAKRLKQNVCKHTVKQRPFGKQPLTFASYLPE